MNSTEIIVLLQDSPLFKKVKSSLLASLLMKASRVMLGAEQILMTPGQMNDQIYIILSGRLRVQLNLYDTKPLAIFGMSECVGEMSMFDDNHVSSYIITDTDCELLSVPHQDAWAVLNESIQASHNMLTILANRIRSTNRVLAESMWDKQNYDEHMQGYEALNYINSVTGIYNRHWLSENIARLIPRHTMNHQPCVFILLKVENFAQFDAHFGTLGSDQALRTIAQSILRCLRPNDVATHISEDMFAVFLPQPAKENVNSVTRRLLEEIGQATISTPSGDALPPITLSVGISQLQFGDTLENLITRAHSSFLSAQEYFTRSAVIE